MLNSWEELLYVETSKFPQKGSIYIYIYIYIYIMYWSHGFPWSHANLSVAVFYLISWRHPYWCVTVVFWLNYVIPAVDLWSSSTQHPVKLAIDTRLGSSAFLYLQNFASHRFWGLTCGKILLFIPYVLTSLN